MDRRKGLFVAQCREIEEHHADDDEDTHDSESELEVFLVFWVE